MCWNMPRWIELKSIPTWMACGYLIDPWAALVSCFFAHYSSVVTHTTANSQRRYIRNANFVVKFDCGVSLNHTSLTDVEVVDMSTNRAIIVVEVRLLVHMQWWLQTLVTQSYPPQCSVITFILTIAYFMFISTTNHITQNPGHYFSGEKEVYLHADNCTGQNKKNTMIQYLYSW